MAITTMQQLNDALPGQRIGLVKIANATAGNAWVSPWVNAGDPPGGATPSSGMAGNLCTSSLAGGIKFTNPASGFSYLGKLDLFSTTGTTISYALVIYDRLWHQNGIVVTTTGAQTINSVALDRPDANGDDVEVWLHVYTTVGAAAATPTISYTNPAGTSGRTGTCIGYATGSAQNRCFPFQLDVGDTGVKSIQSITLGTSLVSGTIGLIMRRKVAMVPIMPSGWGGNPSSQIYDGITLGLPRIYDDACLETISYAPSAFSQGANGTMYIVQG